VAKLVWRVKLFAELQPGVTTETEVARIERNEQADLADLGLRLAEMKQLTAALQAQIVPAQMTMLGGLHLVGGTGRIDDNLWRSSLCGSGASGLDVAAGGNGR